MLGVYNLHAIRVKVGSEEESETYAVRATLGGGDRSVRFVKLLMGSNCRIMILNVQFHWWGCVNRGGEEAVG